MPINDFHEKQREIMDLPTKAKRNLKAEKLEALYSDEELDAMFKRYDAGEKYDLADERYAESFNRLKEEHANKVPREVMRWTVQEDDFLKCTYMYLTDKVIALALNRPVSSVMTRRQFLGYTKDTKTKLDVLIWADRANFEDDILKYSLTKLRPGVFI